MAAMRRLSIFAVCLFAFALTFGSGERFVVSAGAQTGSSARQSTPDTMTTGEDGEETEDRSARLDRLFHRLKRESDPTVAAQTANAISNIWQESGSDTVDQLMKWAATARDKKDYVTALDLLDQVLVLEPDYPEGWNQRAVVHFLMTDYAKSMADIDHVLSLEPRHFGALAGMAGIFKAIGDDELAMKALQRVLAVYPADREAQDRLAKIADTLAGNNI
ncbi:tetratricopeptide repeat protein [Pararhizobium mangrovi]|uniref:Uncharacterized protein n=1 Tax=Pararhizobium mangrovi TaxID=2590452 RepID=A0A506TZP5_9HYPH|nr:hypothetical protein [Pararhizobium mangrovi]TPW26668.1 hypothetical protein FJU11_13760 [Pararhizobium mangrovi]